MVVYQHGAWQQPLAALSITQISPGSLTAAFQPTLAWSPSGAFLALLTTNAELVAIDSALPAFASHCA